MPIFTGLKAICSLTIRRGEIWIVEVDPTTGSRNPEDSATCLLFPTSPSRRVV